MNDDRTLREAVVAFHKKNEALFSSHSASLAGTQFLEDHDVAHVIFGCDTSIYGEGVVKIWTTFGSTLSFWKIIKGYQDANAFDLARKFSFGHVFKHIFRFLIVIPVVIYRAKKMSKPWPFDDYGSLLDTPLRDVRKNYGIEVIK